ncbi:hypothetical protein ABAC402_01375 [Asticcacaulis sp. AC402]|nr:hypothetical protein ABAC402_01375 [Asticcacaulis sp. AC402]
MIITTPFVELAIQEDPSVSTRYGLRPSLARHLPIFDWEEKKFEFTRGLTLSLI